MAVPGGFPFVPAKVVRFENVCAWASTARLKVRARQVRAIPRASEFGFDFIQNPLFKLREACCADSKLVVARPSILMCRSNHRADSGHGLHARPLHHSNYGVISKTVPRPFVPPPSIVVPYSFPERSSSAPLLGYAPSVPPPKSCRIVSVQVPSPFGETSYAAPKLPVAAAVPKMFPAESTVMPASGRQAGEHEEGKSTKVLSAQPPPDDAESWNTVPHPSLPPVAV